MHIHCVFECIYTVFWYIFTLCNMSVCTHCIRVYVHSVFKYTQCVWVCIHCIFKCIYTVYLMYVHCVLRVYVHSVFECIHTVYSSVYTQCIYVSIYCLGQPVHLMQRFSKYINTGMEICFQTNVHFFSKIFITHWRQDNMTINDTTKICNKQLYIGEEQKLVLER